MDLNTVVPIGLKPTVRSLTWEEYEEYELPGRGDCLVSWYFCDAEAQTMMRLRDGDTLWSGSWAWLSEQEAMNTARAEAFKDGIIEGRNLFFRIEDSRDNLARAIGRDLKTKPPAMAIDPIIERHIDAGDSCLIALFDPHKGELQQYRVNECYLCWWHTERPLTREAARDRVTRTMDQYEIPADGLEYIESLHPKKVS